MSTACRVVALVSLVIAPGAHAAGDGFDPTSTTVIGRSAPAPLSLEEALARKAAERSASEGTARDMLDGLGGGAGSDAPMAKGDPAGTVLPYARGAEPADGVPLDLSARLTDTAEPLQSGVEWRVFSAAPAGDGSHRLIARSPEAAPRLLLPPGEYLVHAAFGWGGATRRVVLAKDQPATALLDLGAGGLSLSATDGKGLIPTAAVTYDILQESEDGKRVAIARGLTTPDLVRLNAGMYHIVSHYGGINAVVRADVEVRAGKVTELTVAHRAAAVTLKLVAAAGGEALANTRWTVMNEGGEKLHQSIGAFPRVVLAEGTYTAIARRKGLTYAREFQVTAGRSGDVEVLTSQALASAPAK